MDIIEYIPELLGASAPPPIMEYDIRVLLTHSKKKTQKLISLEDGQLMAAAGLAYAVTHLPYLANYNWNLLHPIAGGGIAYAADLAWKGYKKYQQWRGVRSAVRDAARIYRYAGGAYTVSGRAGRRGGGFGSARVVGTHTLRQRGRFNRTGTARSRHSRGPWKRNWKGRFYRRPRPDA